MPFIPHHLVPLLAGLLLGSELLQAAELEVQLEPDNGALRQNVVNYIGDLGDRSGTELERYRSVARDQAEMALQALGYYHADIRAEVRDGDEPSLVLSIRSGEPVRLRQVQVQVRGEAAGLAAFKVPRQRLRPGEVLDHGAYETVKQQILNQASRYGFFDGRFVEQRLLIDPEAYAADVSLLYDSGPRYHLGEVRFSDDLPLARDLLRRMVPFREGAPYDAERIAELNQALQASGYFDRVRVDANPAAAQDARIPVEVQLAMREPRTFGFGLGYSTDVGPRVRFEWQRHWFNPQGHRYGAEAEWSAPRQNVALWYEVPLDPPLTDRLRFAGGYQYEELADEDSLSRLLSVGPEWYSRLDSGWERTLSLKYQHEEYRLGDDEGISTLLMPGVAYSFLQSDSRIDPNRGYRIELALAGAKEGLLSDADIVHGEASLKGLYTLWERHRLLGRVQVGGNLSSEYKAVPPSLRFFAGGDQSVRGYDYQSLSPTNTRGEHIGGRYQFAASAEYQYSITEKWRVATFVDQGNAFDSLDFPTLKSSVGIGIRWVSPVGPVRLDLARPLDGGDGFRLHFAVGPEL